MYITCTAIWNAGITKDKVSCCESCHVDDEEFGMGMIEYYEDDIGLPQTTVFGKVVGEVCCTVSHAIDELPNKQEVLRKIWETNA